MEDIPIMRKLHLPELAVLGGLKWVDASRILDGVTFVRLDEHSWPSQGEADRTSRRARLVDSCAPCLAAARRTASIGCEGTWGWVPRWTDLWVHRCQT